VSQAVNALSAGTVPLYDFGVGLRVCVGGGSAALGLSVLLWCAVLCCAGPVFWAATPCAVFYARCRPHLPGEKW
jgi:hypothetical protein